MSKKKKEKAEKNAEHIHEVRGAAPSERDMPPRARAHGIRLDHLLSQIFEYLTHKLRLH